MKSGHIFTQAHCKDENGDTVVVSIRRGGYQGETRIGLSQFKGPSVIEWQKEVTIEELRDYVLNRDKVEMTDEQKQGDFTIKSINLIIDSLERHRERIAAQAQADGPADLDELNAAVARGEA